jgi:hypothetical protein
MDPDPSTCVRASVRRGRHALHAVAVRNGTDLSVTVGGGDRPHVGCVAIAQPHPSTADPARRSATVSLLAIPPHKEGGMATEIAGGLARRFGVVVVVAAGVHTDDLPVEGIAVFQALATDLERELAARIAESRQNG